MKYGHIHPKIAAVTPWKHMCVDLIGPYTIKAKEKTILAVMCLTMINPATSWFESLELPNTKVHVLRKGDKEVKIMIDK